MSRMKVWPHLTILAILCAIAGGVAAALWFRNEPTAEALNAARAARIERVDGEVGITRGLEGEQSAESWAEATPNMPLTVGDRLYAGDDSLAGVAFTGRNFARLEPDTSLDVLSLSDERTQLALRGGSAIFDIGSLDSGELYEVATPVGAVELREPGLYHLGMNDDGSAFVSVLSGLAQVVGLAGSGEISKGEMLTLLGQTAAEIALSRLDPEFAGGLLDDYYGYRYPDYYDGRYGDYNAYLSDPDYYDPYNRYVSYRYVPEAIPGAWELDSYGDWQELNNYGYVWRPRVEQGWAPYQQGYWTMDDPYGLTWVSTEPWGYAPYHYGRWANVNNQWYWVPEGLNEQAAYAPALVAFLPLTQSNQIGWVPLAPGDPYVQTYYDPNWQPHYVNGEQLVPERVINLGVPGAVTVVPLDYFGRVIEPELVVRAEPATFGQARPVLDPLSVAMLRQASLDRAIARRGFVLPPGLAKRLNDTQVYVSERPQAPPFVREQARALRVEAIPDERKREKLKFKDERAADVARRQEEARPQREGGARERMSADGRGQDRREARGVEAGRGRGEERRQLRQLERQQEVRQAAARAVNERAVKRVEQQAQGERVGLRQQQKQAARQHAGGGPPQRIRVEQPQQARPNRAAQGPPARQELKQRAQPQPKAERKQGPPAHAGGGGPQPKAQGNPGKGKGKN